MKVFVVVTPGRKLSLEEATYVSAELYAYGVARATRGVYGNITPNGDRYDRVSPMAFTERGTLSVHAEHPGAAVQLQLAGVAMFVLDRLGIPYEWRASSETDTQEVNDLLDSRP